jgi:dolichol-phosphate mannosyltransferase
VDPLPVTLVVPCFQEEAALERFAALLPRLDADALVFVDDGSHDATPARLAALARADARVRVVTHPANRGVGAAMRTGLAAVTEGIAVVYDADRTYPPEDIARLVALVRAGADVATASPLSLDGAMEGVPAWRRALTRMAAWAYRVVIGRRARGVATFTCAFRAYAPRACRVVAPTADGFSAAAEMLGRALLAGLSVVEHPARLSTRTEGVSKMRVGRALASHLGALGRLLRLRLGGRGGAG